MEIPACHLTASNRASGGQKKKAAGNNPEIRTTDLVGQIKIIGHSLDTSNSGGNSL